jgi:hypothetical protein
MLCIAGIAYGANAIYIRRIRFIFWTMKEPGDSSYDDDAFTVTGLPAVALGAVTIASSLYMMKAHVL